MVWFCCLCQLFEATSGESGVAHLHNQLKTASIYSAVNGRPSILLVHEDIGDECLDDVCAFLKDGERLSHLSCFPRSVILPNFCTNIWMVIVFSVFSSCFYFLKLSVYGAVTYWRHGSVVRTSVFNWRTFPDLHLIYGWHVTTSWVRRPLWVNQPGQLSLPSLWGR